MSYEIKIQHKQEKNTTQILGRVTPVVSKRSQKDLTEEIKALWSEWLEYPYYPKFGFIQYLVLTGAYYLASKELWDRTPDFISVTVQ